MSRQPHPLARSSDLNVQNTGNETLIYDRKTDKAFVLNPTATAVWRAANGQRTVKDIATYLSKETPTSEQTVWYALGQLDELLKEPLALPPEMTKLSRRNFLKMSGVVAAGVGIPVVVMLVAPNSAHAASCVVNGSCIDPSQCEICCSGCGEDSGCLSGTGCL